MLPSESTDNRNITSLSHTAAISFSSNCVRLSVYEWMCVGILASAVFCCGPWVWQRIEKMEPEADSRMPYELGNDYWLYARYCRWASSKYEALVIGDSVIWGHYVPQHRTLSHYLNDIADRDEFANLGVDGIHPVALAGLLEYYGHDISDKKVVLHFNPLWMSSRKHDLQTEKEFLFNHPKLVPQFIPRIPCYRDAYSKRVFAVLERYVPLACWTSHLKIAYFENSDLPTWTLEHPYRNPASAVALYFRTAANDSEIEHMSWEESGTAKTDVQWVGLESSLQWKFFRQSIKLLMKRGNRVFVVVGPFNEHMLKGESIEVYRKIKSGIEDWLQQNNIAYYMPGTLPSKWYVDASHPMSEGYEMLARQLFENGCSGL